MESGRRKALLFQRSCPLCQNYGSAGGLYNGQAAGPVRILRSDARARRDLVNTASFKYRLAAGLGEFASGGNAA